MKSITRTLQILTTHAAVLKGAWGADITDSMNEITYAPHKNSTTNQWECYIRSRSVNLAKGQGNTPEEAQTQAVMNFKVAVEKAFQEKHTAQRNDILQREQRLKDSLAEADVILKEFEALCEIG